jgi:DNA mismatch endonuclease, patch repair protein
MGRQWREGSLDDSAWRPPSGLSRSARAAEQDAAAGGRERRVVSGTSRPVLASIYFRRTAGRRVYAYLRWAENGRTTEQFVCEVDRGTRAENLSFAWTSAHDRKLLAATKVEDAESSSPAERPSWAASEVVRKQMQANRSRDTRPELALRSRLHELGLRYRVAARPLPDVRRTADLVFTRARVAVFLDGCFWHGCPEHHRPSRRNEEFWHEKIAHNRERDAETDSLLEAAGWTVIRVWEHEQPDLAAQRVRAVVLSRAADRAKL